MIVATARRQLRRFAGHSYSLLRTKDCRSRFEGDAKEDVLSVADSALNSPGMICSGSHLAFPNFKGIIVLGASQLRAGEARPDFKPFRGREAEHRLRKVGLQLVEDRFSKSGRNPSDHALDHATDRVSVFSHRLDEIDHSLGSHRIRAANNRFFDVRNSNFRGIHHAFNALYALYVGDNLEFGKPVTQHLFGDGASSNTTDCFTSRGTTPALPIPDAVLLMIRVVSVRRTKSRLHLAIRFRTRVLIPNQDRDWRSKSEPFKSPGENLAPIFFRSWGHNFALSGAPPVKIRLEIGLR